MKIKYSIKEPEITKRSYGYYISTEVRKIDSTHNCHEITFLAEVHHTNWFEKKILRKTTQQKVLDRVNALHAQAVRYIAEHEKFDSDLIKIKEKIKNDGEE